MNERQRDLFLYVWSRRRAPGQAAVALRGALIGALGGLVFALFMANGIDFGGGKGGSDIAALFTRAGGLFAMSIAAFGGIGFLGANRVYASQEAMYQSILATGAQVPAQKPVMQAGDRGPAVAAGITVVVIIGFILFVAMRLG